MNPLSSIEILPLTPGRWPDLEALFSSHGTVRGCWCMFWRLPGSAFERGWGGENRDSMRGLAVAGREPGRLERSPKLRRIDDVPVWSIVCFFVEPRQRGRGIAGALIHAAVEHAAARGATVVEAYPTLTADSRVPAGDVYTGTVSMFRAAGFEVVVEQAGSRAIVRRSTALPFVR